MNMIRHPLRSENGISLQIPIHGYGVNIFGGIAGAAKILRLTVDLSLIFDDNWL